MKPLILIVTLYAAAAMAQTPSTERNKPDGNGPAIDDRATAALTKMTNFLKTLKNFSIHSESTRDEVVDTDMKIQKNASNDITVRVPDRLHANVRSDDHDLEFVYDGQTLTLLNAKANYYASTPAPPTVSRTLDVIRARYGIVFPLADFIQMTAAGNVMENITAAGYIGTSRIDGVDCDHLAVRQSDVDWQVWIERSETPLPRKLVITTKKESVQPQYVAKLNWDLSPQINDHLFTFTPPPNAVRIKFARIKEGDQIPAP
jgi:hypothetical protein